MKFEPDAFEAKIPENAPINIESLAFVDVSPDWVPKKIPLLGLRLLVNGFTEYNVDPVVWIEGVITFKAWDAVTARDDEVANDALKAYEALVTNDAVVANDALKAYEALVTNEAVVATDLLVANDELKARDDEIANDAVNGFITPG
jgi:hypothetical protein